MERVRIVYCVITEAKPAGNLYTFSGTEREFQYAMRGVETTPGFVKWGRCSTISITSRPS